MEKRAAFSLAITCFSIPLLQEFRVQLNRGIWRLDLLLVIRHSRSLRPERYTILGSPARHWLGLLDLLRNRNLQKSFTSLCASCVPRSILYQSVAPSAWPLRAMIERDRMELLPSLIPKLLLRAEEIKLLVSRSEAVFLLFQHVFPASREHWFPVLDSLRQASTPLINWRQKRNLTDAIMIVRGEDEQLAFEIYDAVDDLGYIF